MGDCINDVIVLETRRLIKVDPKMRIVGDIGGHGAVVVDMPQLLGIAREIRGIAVIDAAFEEVTVLQQRGEDFVETTDVVSYLRFL